MIICFLTLTSCNPREDYVDIEQVAGVYKRNYYSVEEILCLSQDNTYKYTIKQNGHDKVVLSGQWDYNKEGEVSRIGISPFNYSVSQNKYLSDSSGINMPVKFSHAKKAVILRYNADEHFQDFIMTDNTCK